MVPNRHAASILDLGEPERLALAGLLGTVLGAYDALFGFPLPYVMTMHQAPTDGADWRPVSHFHMELTPPHRTATKLKYLAASELGGGRSSTTPGPRPPPRYCGRQSSPPEAQWCDPRPATRRRHEASGRPRRRRERSHTGLCEIGCRRSTAGWVRRSARRALKAGRRPGGRSSSSLARPGR